MLRKIQSRCIAHFIYPFVIWYTSLSGDKSHGAYRTEYLSYVNQLFSGSPTDSGTAEAVRTTSKGAVRARDYVIRIIDSKRYEKLELQLKLPRKESVDADVRPKLAY